VVEQNSAEFAFENDGTGTQKSTARIRIQSEAGLQRFAVLTFPYQSATESVEVGYIRVRKPDATIVTTPPDTAQDIASEITRQAPLYSDLREKHIAVKGLSVGDVLEYEVQERIAKPMAPGQFWCSYAFPTDGIILQENVQVSVPRERAVKWRSPKVKPVITESGSRRVFTWTYCLLEPKSKDQEKQNQQTAIYQASRSKLPQADILFSSFQSWEELGRWYNTLQEERAKPTPEIRTKAAELTKGLTDDHAKAVAIYGYVSTGIHYIGIDLGIGRYQPHSAGDVLNNQYGDFKDKHTLLAALMEAAGMRAWPALIGSSHDLDPSVPTPAQFDHVVSAVQIDNHLTWLDTTPEVAPFAFLFSGLRGKNALLVPISRPRSRLPRLIRWCSLRTHSWLTPS